MVSTQQGAKITVYWLDKSRGQRIIWLLEELNLEYDIKVYKRNEAGRAAGPELKEIHPLGRSPTIGITPAGSEKEIIITESETVVEYVCEHFGKQLIPARYPEGKEGVLGAETEEWMRYKVCESPNGIQSNPLTRHQFLMDYAEGSLFTILIVALISRKIKDSQVPFFIKPIVKGVAGNIDSSYVDPELKNHFDFLEDYVSKSSGEFLAGSTLSGADIMMHFCLEGACQRVPLSETSYPKLYTYMRKMQERDAYKKAADRVTEASGEKYVPYSDLKRS
ncbi:glutathione S-transferas-like protein [Plenodomus tracheiphilus IPT5]|uniref:Glutathione S-transferas-like protein n=1 Tax=Plenodomus tracheiphilus IPT5 TaxID=1408161 RepID=A0A6A7AS82_9PLEO|nr:glutathione S-transferas-like protein [Plenodomus tracheiphilus IPT5]